MRTLALTAVLLGVSGLGASLLDSGPLPEPPARNCIREVFPQMDLDEMEVGGYEFQAYEAVGRQNRRPPLLDVLEPHRCVSFVYDERVLRDPLAITVRIDDGKISGRWLTEVPFDRPECTGLPRELSELRGYFHAGACWGPRW